jgi:hypothetical protein
MPDYQKSKIYKIFSPSKNLVYYGSTIQTLAQRLTDHKKHYNMFKNNNYHYVTSFKILECEDYKMELVEDYPCNNKEQLARKEGEYIRNNECVNRCIAGRTKDEWYVDNIKKIKQYNIDNAEKIKNASKQYKLINAEKLKIQVKTYYEKNKEKINKERVIYNEKYREKNKEKMKEYKKQYYLKKKQPINDD